MFAACLAFLLINLISFSKYNRQPFIFNVLIANINTTTYSCFIKCVNYNFKVGKSLATAGGNRNNKHYQMALIFCKNGLKIQIPLDGIFRVCVCVFGSFCIFWFLAPQLRSLYLLVNKSTNITTISPRITSNRNNLWQDLSVLVASFIVATYRNACVKLHLSYFTIDKPNEDICLTFPRMQMTRKWLGSVA